MEIRDIKQQLPIEAVLHYYGLQPDKQQRLNCPFHPDKNPSLQVYPKTNTYCCFSSNCKAGTGDVIQFIQLKEQCSKREALVKATAMIEGSSLPLISPIPITGLILSPVPSATTPLEKIAVLTKLFSYWSRGLPSSKKAVQYLEGRAIDYKQHEIGYNAGDWHHHLNEKHFVQSAAHYGLLKQRPAGGYGVWAKDCVLFPLKNAANKIVSLYGRSRSNDSDQRHFYLQGREGLYPGYPLTTTKKLILIESIIDAVSLLQQPSIQEQYSILSLYGTNGLTEEHQLALTSLPHLQEIILVLNGDEAGAAATVKHTQTLQALLPEVLITNVTLPAGEDINSLLQTHADPQILSDLIEQRASTQVVNPDEPFLFSIENKNLHPAEILAQPALPTNQKLNAGNPELLIYDDMDLRIEVLGGIKITGLDRMKVTLKILHQDKLKLPAWHSLDLYNHGQREQVISSIAESFDLGISNVTAILTEATSALEQYRLQRIEALAPKETKQPELTAAQRQQAIAELQMPNLIQRTAQLIKASGIVGEETNSLIAYLVYCTRKQLIPLHVMFLGASGSGKTYLQERISELIPQEDKIEITQITENALYYFKQEELKQKLILIEDLDGAASVFYPLRELQTKRRISKTVTLKDSKGNLKTITLTVEGPVCVSGCTTKEKIYEDNANRCILLYTDMSREQDQRINQYQTNLSAGTINREKESQYRQLFQHMQRILRPINIINPFASYIQLPEQVFKPRRTMTLLLGFIEAITFYHQYQREVKKDASGQLYIETTITDIESAFTLLKDVLFSKSDELTRATRSFLEQLKGYLADNNLPSFTPQQIRKAFRIEPRTIQRYVRELKQYGLIKSVSGFAHRRGYEYAVVDGGEYTQLRSAIDEHLQEILHQLRQSTATATVLRQ